jgi:intraflagellar transport protein 80
MALYARELNTAEIALAAIDEVDKIQFINYVKMIPSEAGRNAELALFSKRLQEAEQILLQAKLYYRAIKMNIKLYKWERALDIAFANKKHVDTVLGYRKRYLEKIQREENMDKFKKLMDGGIEVNWVAIKTKIKQEKEAEAMSGKPYEAQ